MLAVGIHHHAVLVAPLRAVAKTGLHGSAIAQIVGQSYHCRAQPCCHPTRVIAGMVIHHEDVGIRRDLPQLRDHVGQVLRFVVRGDDDQGGGHDGRLSQMIPSSK